MFAHKLVLFVVGASLAVVGGNTIEDLKKTIKQLDEEYETITLENNQLQLEYDNLTSVYRDFIQNSQIKQNLLDESIVLLIKTLQGKQAEIFGLQVKKHLLQEELEGLKKTGDKLDLAIRDIGKELEILRLGKSSGDAALCHQHKSAKQILFRSSAKPGGDNVQIEILKAKVKQAQERVWNVQDETELLKIKIDNQKDTLKRKSDRIIQEIDRLALEQNDLENTIGGLNEKIKKLEEEIEGLDKNKEWKKIIGDRWTTINEFKKEYKSFQGDISCYEWLQDWAFSHEETDDSSSEEDSD